MNIPIALAGIGDNVIGRGNIVPHPDGRGYRLNIVASDPLLDRLVETVDEAPVMKIELVVHFEKATPEGNSDGTQQR